MKRKIWLMASGAGLALVVVGLVSFYLIYGKMVVKPKAVIINPAVSPTATPTPDPLAPYSILLLGYGGGIHEGGQLTDSMMVVRIEPRNQKIMMISVPRDLWVSIPMSGTTEMDSKINVAFANGGGETAKTVVGDVVGFKIDYFVALDFDGFIKMIDILGGININVARTFDDPWYPIENSIGVGNTDSCGKSGDEVKTLTATMSGDKLEQQFTCRYEKLHFDKGVQHMDGITALKYARSRHSPTEQGDFNRATRQRQVILAVKDKVLNIGFITKIIPTIKTMTKNLTTDIDFTEMDKLLLNALELAKYKIVPVALTDQNVLKDAISDNRQDILVPRIGETDWSEVQQYIADPSMILPTLTPIPTPTVKISN